MKQQTMGSEKQSRRDDPAQGEKSIDPNVLSPAMIPVSRAKRPASELTVLEVVDARDAGADPSVANPGEPSNNLAAVMYVPVELRVELGCGVVAAIPETGAWGKSLYRVK